MSPYRPWTCRGALLAVIVAPMLCACIEDSATFNVAGSDYAMTVRREQKYFWQKTVEVSLLASHLPDCRRLYRLSDDADAALKIEVFATRPGLWTVRWDSDIWQFDARQCDQMTQLKSAPKDGLGPLAGVFEVADGRMVFNESPDRPKQVEADKDDEADAGDSAPQK